MSSRFNKCCRDLVISCNVIWHTIEIARATLLHLKIMILQSSMFSKCRRYLVNICVDLIKIASNLDLDMELNFDTNGTPYFSATVHICSPIP